MRPATPSPEVSVVLATHGRPEELPRALDSLGAQTLAPHRFEVVVVPNGPPSAVREVLDRCRGSHPGLLLREVVSRRPGVAHARAVGVAAARGAWMTMLDDDDWVSPAYLERLLEAAEPGVVPLAQIADVAEPGAEPDLHNPYALAFAAHRGRRVAADLLPEAVSLNVCKLLPTATARAAGFDTRLRSASDTLFWLGVLARSGWTFSVLERDDAVYYRVRGHGSLSRQDLGLDFSVVRRLEGLRSLAEVPRTRRSLEPVLDRTARSLSTHVRHFLLAHPERREEVAGLAEAAADAPVDWHAVNRWTAREALLLPRPDLAAPPVLAALRRVRERGVVTDVLAQAPAAHLHTDPDVALARPWLGRVVAPGAGEDVVTWALARVDATAGRDRPYEVVRTAADDDGRLARALRRARPDLRWVAEVDGGSDPVSVGGADELVAADADALQAFLARCARPEEAAALAERATVAAPAPLPPHLWRGAAGSAEVTVLAVHLGDLAPSALEPVAALVRALPGARRARGAVVVCTSRPEETRAAARDLGVADCLRARPLPGLRAGLDLLARARVLLLDRPAPPHLAAEAAAHPHVLDPCRPGAAEALAAAAAAVGP